MIPVSLGISRPLPVSSANDLIWYAIRIRSGATATGGGEIDESAIGGSEVELLAVA